MNTQQPHAMVVTDLDGTLLDSNGILRDADRDTLTRLGSAGVLRVVATGRSLYSARNVVDDAFPIDILAFSSGAGIMDWRTQTLVHAQHMASDIAIQVAHHLIEGEMDFMLHHEVPETHAFHYFRSSPVNHDFDRRCERYRDFAHPWNAEEALAREVSQFLVIEPPGREHRHAALSRGLANVNVIRTTSPLDGSSMWVEIFPSSVCKAAAAEWIAQRFAIDPVRSLGIGNDYNDIDLLDWTAHSYLVGNAAADLQQTHRVVASNDEAGFSEAVQCWMPVL